MLDSFHKVSLMVCATLIPTTSASSSSEAFLMRATLFHKVSLMVCATLIPTTSASSSSEAFLMRATLLKCFSSASLRILPTPLMPSSAEAIWLLLRLSRWKVMAKRWTSFCMFSNKWKRGVPCLSPMFLGGKPVVFGKSGYRDMQTEFVFDDLAHHFHLSFAAIG